MPKPGGAPPVAKPSLARSGFDSLRAASAQLRMLCAVVSQPMDYLPTDARTVVGVVGVVSVLNGLGLLIYAWYLHG